MVLTKIRNFYKRKKFKSAYSHSGFISIFLRWVRGTRVPLLTTINNDFFSNLIFDFKGAADFFKCMIAKIGAFLKFFLFLKLSYFCDKHLISFEDNTFPKILIFHTVLGHMRKTLINK